MKGTIMTKAKYRAMIVRIIEDAIVFALMMLAVFAIPQVISAVLKMLGVG